MRFRICPKPTLFPLKLFVVIIVTIERKALAAFARYPKKNNLVTIKTLYNC